MAADGVSGSRHLHRPGLASGVARSRGMTAQSVKPARASSSFGRTLPRKHSQSTRLIEVGEEGIDLRQQLGTVQVRLKRVRTAKCT
jgi:hypothetical protein